MRAPGRDAATPAARHAPVLLREVLNILDPRAGAVFVDGTFGAGGHARALLDAADCVVWGIDRDPDAVARGRALAADHDGRLRILEGRFGAMRELLGAAGVDAVDGIVLDLGVSSPQLDSAARGFAFAQDGPLDMRMERRGPTAADLVNGTPERALADIIHRYGEERLARRIARAIVAARAAAPVATTRELADIVRAVVPARRAPRHGIDPATRTFQALRIQVNDELGELDRGLAAAEQLLVAGGRLAVIAFHSLEDRRVKRFLRARAGGAGRSRHLPDAAVPAPSFSLVTRRVVRPRAAETAANPRARSARLRGAERTAAPAWPATERAA